jgi:hypothetical protein
LLDLSSQEIPFFMSLGNPFFPHLRFSSPIGSAVTNLEFGIKEFCRNKCLTDFGKFAGISKKSKSSFPQIKILGLIIPEKESNICSTLELGQKITLASLRVLNEGLSLRNFGAKNETSDSSENKSPER